MRIIDTYSRFNGPTVDTAKQGAAVAPKPTADDTKQVAPAEGGDAVTVSAKAIELSQQAAAHAENAKVQHLRSAIANGTFQIDRQAIARRIVDGG